MHVRIDRNVCEGTAYCVRVLPQVFALDDEGFAFAVVDDADDGLLEQLEEAERLCPVGAVLLGA